MKNQNKKIANIFKSSTSEITHGIHITYLTHDDQPDWRSSLNFISEFTRLLKYLHNVDVSFTGDAWPTDKSISKEYELMFSSSRQLEISEVQDCFKLMEFEYLITEYTSNTYVEDFEFNDCEILRRNYNLSHQEVYQFTNKEMKEIFGKHWKAFSNC